ncbi:MAG: cob(I)yrinic acid a,c-diamide adenosyltransferase, partial [Tissierellia bacterium]|nr:cob(I)yrinic acid a,c-diamide adenosyltransferase [Tissierellia bacterium]
MKEKRYIHLYTGDGKGKTTAAFGLAVRAACAGLNVYIGQFVKGMEYSEVGVQKVMSNIKIEQ